PFANANAVSNTTIKMWVVDGVAGITGDQEPSTGATYSANDINLDDYRRFGVGLYRVEVKNVGPYWKCEFSAYIQFDGGVLSKPAGWVALGAVVLGVMGVLYTKGRKPRYPGWIDGGLGTADQIAREEAWQAAGQRHPDALDFVERGEHGWRPPSTLAPNEEVIWFGK